MGKPFKTYGDAYENEGFALYTLKNRKSFEEFSKQRENGRRLNFHFEDNENGTRNSGEDRFSLKEKQQSSLTPDVQAPDLTS